MPKNGQQLIILKQDFITLEIGNKVICLCNDFNVIHQECALARNNIGEHSANVLLLQKFCQVKVFCQTFPLH